MSPVKRSFLQTCKRSYGIFGAFRLQPGYIVARGCGKQSGSCHFQSGPDKSPVRSNTIPDFRDIPVDFVMIPRCRKTRWSERVGHGPACAHGDTACFRILTESGIMLWRHRLLNTIASKFFSESCVCNLRSETWRRWLSACLRTHLMCAPSPGCGWKI